MFLSAQELQGQLGDRLMWAWPVWSWVGSSGVFHHPVGPLGAGWSRGGLKCVITMSFMHLSYYSNRPIQAFPMAVTYREAKIKTDAFSKSLFQSTLWTAILTDAPDGAKGQGERGPKRMAWDAGGVEIQDSQHHASAPHAGPHKHQWQCTRRAQVVKEFVSANLTCRNKAVTTICTSKIAAPSVWGNGVPIWPRCPSYKCLFWYRQPNKSCRGYKDLARKTLLHLGFNFLNEENDTHNRGSITVSVSYGTSIVKQPEGLMFSAPILARSSSPTAPPSAVKTKLTSQQLVHYDHRFAGPTSCPAASATLPFTDIFCKIFELLISPQHSSRSCYPTGTLH